MQDSRCWGALKLEQVGESFRFVFIVFLLLLFYYIFWYQVRVDLVCRVRFNVLYFESNFCNGPTVTSSLVSYAT